MAQSTVDKITPGPKLDALTAEKVFGWQKVHKHQGALVGTRQDKAGHWRRAKMPNYSTNPLHSYSVENRMKQLGRLDRYQNELSKITRSKKTSFRLGFTGSALSGCHQSFGTLRPGPSSTQIGRTRMNIETVRHALLWCAVINYGIFVSVVFSLHTGTRLDASVSWQMV
jgi:hypothetical protein